MHEDGPVEAEWTGRRIRIDKRKWRKIGLQRSPVYKVGRGFDYVIARDSGATHPKTRHLPN